MKKILALFLTIIFISTNSCLAVSELYYIKNAKASEIEPMIEHSFEGNGFTVTQKNPYYGTSTNNNDYAVVILQQSGNNL